MTGISPGDAGALEDDDGASASSSMVNPATIEIVKVAEQTFHVYWPEANEPSRDCYELVLLRKVDGVWQEFEKVKKRSLTHKINVPAIYATVPHKAKVRTLDADGVGLTNLAGEPVYTVDVSTDGVAADPITSGSATSPPTTFSHKATAVPPAISISCTDAAPNDAQDPTTYFYYVSDSTAIATTTAYFVGKTQSRQFTTTEYKDSSGNRQDIVSGRTYYVRVVAKNARNSLESSSGLISVLVKRGTISSGTTATDADADVIVANKIVANAAGSIDADAIIIMDKDPVSGAKVLPYVRFLGNAGNWSQFSAGNASINLNSGGVLDCSLGQIIVTQGKPTNPKPGSFYWNTNGLNIIAAGTGTFYQAKWDLFP